MRAEKERRGIRRTRECCDHIHPRGRGEALRSPDGETLRIERNPRTLKRRFNDSTARRITLRLSDRSDLDPHRLGSGRNDIECATQDETREYEEPREVLLNPS